MRPEARFRRTQRQFYQAADSETAYVGFAVRIDALIRSHSSLVLLEMEKKELSKNASGLRRCHNRKNLFRLVARREFFKNRVFWILKCFYLFATSTNEDTRNPQILSTVFDLFSKALFNGSRFNSIGATLIFADVLRA